MLSKRYSPPPPRPLCRPAVRSTGRTLSRHSDRPWVLGMSVQQNLAIWNGARGQQCLKARYTEPVPARTSPVPLGRRSFLHSVWMAGLDFISPFQSRDGCADRSSGGYGRQFIGYAVFRHRGLAFWALSGEPAGPELAEALRIARPVERSRRIYVHLYETVIPASRQFGAPGGPEPLAGRA